MQEVRGEVQKVSFVPETRGVLMDGHGDHSGQDAPLLTPTMSL